MSDLDNDRKYQFTESQDWFSFNADIWRQLFSKIQSSSPRALEIGTWEGRSAVFLLDELCGTTGSLTCIDHFDLMGTVAGKDRYKRVMHNLTATGKTFRVVDQFSMPALMMLLREEISSDTPGFDFIYVDGSHEADDTLLDGELAWRLARKGAIFIFDDYDWNVEPKDSRHHPKRGVDAFMALHSGEYERLSSESQYQMVLQKTSEMRIGFLVDGGRGDGPASFGYSINVAYTIDDAFAMPLAVSLRSLLLHTNGRISAYILVHKVAEDVREKIRRSLPERDNFTLQFLELKDTSPAATSGMAWAKVSVDLAREDLC
jgi:predicted O-methyltransferase YrrM